jgi:sarcosine oxidase subunit alpha
MRFSWNNRTVAAKSGDTVAGALYRAGITSIAKTRKLHEPLGYSGSFVAGVLARVDGRPNVRLDRQIVADGMLVEAQNRWPGTSFDLLALLRLLPPALVYGGFEHGRFTPQSGRLYLLWDRLLAELAGVSKPPEETLSFIERPARRIEVDTVVVGGGPAGQAAANYAARSGKTVALVTRGSALGRYATAMGITPGELHGKVQVFTGMELCGCYRGGTLLVAAPIRPDLGAVAFQASHLVLAGGRRSMPPLVHGNHLPGVMDVHAALSLAHAHAVPYGQRIGVVGTGSEQQVADRLTSLGAHIVHAGPVSGLKHIRGRSRVASIDVGRDIACDALVHAGTWHADPGLPFQARADGQLQLSDVMREVSVDVVGSAALSDEEIFVPRRLDPRTRICPCMDVTAGELVGLIEAGETEPEVLKRLTSCGMGPCQGFPCWESMLALLAGLTGKRVDAYTRPSHRPPRAALTVGQAAGLCDVVELLR